MKHGGRGTDESALLERLRFGEDAAFGELFERHATAVRRLARGLASDSSEAEDITAETFFRVLQAMRRGNGPRDNVRAYLLTVARRVSWEWHGNRRDIPVTDDELASRADSRSDSQNHTAESTLITRAFSSLPERWRTVLWQTEVEGFQPAHAARGFGLTANATAALARRARLGLRAAYLQAHLAADHSDAGCRTVVERLGAYTAGGVTGSEARKISSHLRMCSSCRATHDELRDVCYSLRAQASAIVLLVPAAGLAGAMAGTAGTVGAGAGVGGATAAASASAGAAATGGAVVLGKAGMALASTALVGAVGIAGPLVLPQLSSDIGLPGGGHGAELWIADPTGSSRESPSVISGSAVAAEHVPSTASGESPRYGAPRPAVLPRETATGGVSVELNAEVDATTTPVVSTELPGEADGDATDHTTTPGDGRDDIEDPDSTATPVESTTVSSTPLPSSTVSSTTAESTTVSSTSQPPTTVPSTSVPHSTPPESSSAVGDDCAPGTRCAPKAPTGYRGE